MMSEEMAQVIWAFGVIAWFVIRLPHQRRSRKTPIARSTGGWRDRVLLTISLTGLGLIPGVYLFTGEPQFADYRFIPIQGYVGGILMAGALVLFWLTHKQLGRYWSVTLDTRKTHKLIDTGIYAQLRHPMYSAFWLLALAQAVLLSNWIAGLAGPLGWAIIFFLRIGREEKMMVDTFGDDYLRYIRRTKRVLPGIY